LNDTDAQASLGVEAVVVAFGAPELLAECLTVLGSEIPVTVVDNSSDQRVRTISQEHGAHYVDPGRNLGFAAGVNLGLARRQRPDYDVLLVNPDATVTLQCVSALDQCLHRRVDLACAAPAQIDPTGTEPARVGWPFPTPLGAWVEAIGLGRIRGSRDFMIGSVLLIRAKALSEVGELDEQFFLYAEETDWQRRAHDLGWKMAFCPEATATHIGAGTGGDSQQRSLHFHASQERYIRKHHGSAGWQIYRWGMMAGALLRSLILPGPRGRSAAFRFHLYRQGPCMVESGR